MIIIVEKETNNDPEDMKGLLSNIHKQVTGGFSAGGKLKVDDIDKIVVAGMGGSALPGEILDSFIGSKFPIIINKDYDLPELVNSKTLVFAISYSGNTEETIQAYRDAIRKGAKIIVIASGGKLDVLAKKQGYPVIPVERGMPPRMSYCSMFFSMLRVLQNSGIVENLEKEVEEISHMLKKPMFSEKGEELAELLVNKTPIIYTSKRMKAVAYKWKINFNENCKIHAFYNYFPELNHNEMLGYTTPGQNFYALMLKDDYDHARVKLRMDITKNLLKQKNIGVTEIGITGAHMLSKIFSAIYIGDWVSYHLALKLGVDPTPVKLIEEFKKNLA